ncbi:hypothetical protein [Hydrogenophaga sp.]|uniref:hypothetical protein n=1 Tax=Hydrogenophaga sp. TaxID=1904254 RepID=UPI00263566C3|nr:hypothetical protein [Hydrogenophaga sp.]MCW5654070.1 hypothetical protein [Hydrogenophaga sp.]
MSPTGDRAPYRSILSLTLPNGFLLTRAANKASCLVDLEVDPSGLVGRIAALPRLALPEPRLLKDHLDLTPG